MEKEIVPTANDVQTIVNVVNNLKKLLSDMTDIKIRPTWSFYDQALDFELIKSMRAYSAKLTSPLSPTMNVFIRKMAYPQDNVISLAFPKLKFTEGLSIALIEKRFEILEVLEDVLSEATGVISTEVSYKVTLEDDLVEGLYWIFKISAVPTKV